MSWMAILKNVELDEDNCCEALASHLELLFEHLIFNDFIGFIKKNKNNCEVLVPEVERILGEGMPYFKRKYIIDSQILSVADEDEIYQVIKDMYARYLDCNEDLLSIGEDMR